ncbi:right-handed parallel beta-helix repeat-containing protein [Bacillus spongiae]|uniref:Right-handed parallel beta-helix repeat-containing protein n=1 Tax=Bacillus spongiae TaxID=2683610 RepID=A0ABU8HES5_9BACI
MVLRTVPTVAFPTVQDAIDASTSGDSIKILAGTFDGFEVNVENLKIFGCGIGRTIIAGAPAQGSNNGVVVDADRTTLQGFTVQGFDQSGVISLSSNNVLKEIESKLNNNGFFTGSNNTFLNCIASFNLIGFLSRGGSSCIISCDSSQNSQHGFDLTLTIAYKFISNTTKRNGLTGFRLLTSLGNLAVSNTLFANKVFKNGDDGIRLQTIPGGPTPTSNNNIIENVVCDNEDSGIRLFLFASENVIDSNIVRNNGTANSDAGILIEDSAVDNTIRFNKAKNNFEFDIEAIPPADVNNTFDGNKCSNSFPPTGICDS